MALPTGKVGNSKIFQKLKETTKSLMEAWTYDGVPDKVWEPWVKHWALENVQTLAWTRYPVVFFVIPRYRSVRAAIGGRKRWTVELQIEFYFENYNTSDETVCLEWIEELESMIVENPKMGQPSPTDFKIEDWTMIGSDIDYFVENDHLMMGAICLTEVKLIDCRR